MARTIDLDKIQAANEKLESNPDRLAKVNEELKKFFATLGVDLNDNERRYFLSEVITEAHGDRAGFGCSNVGYCP